MATNAPSSSTYVEPLERQRGAVTILVVGVPDDVRDGIGSALEDLVGAVELVEASTAPAALACLEDDTVDCIVSSDELPDSEGLALLRKVRASHGTLPFVLRPTDGSERLATEAINAGVDGYFPGESGSTTEFEALADRIESIVAEERTKTDLAETTRLLLRLTEYTTDTLWMFTDDWSETVVVNSAYDDVWGRSVDDLIDDPEDFLQGVHPDDVEGVVEKMGQLSTGEPADLEYRITVDGETRWTSVHAEPVFDGEGEIEYVAGFTRDVDELKNRELSMQALNRASTELLAARDEEEVARVVTDIVESVIGCPMSVVRVSDGTALAPVVASDGAFETLDAEDLSDVTTLAPDDAVYEAFETGETRALDGDATLDGLGLPPEQVESVHAVPLGDHGLVTVGTASGDPLSAFERELLGILARTATAALDRVERDQVLENYRSKLEHSNENLQQFAYTASHDLQEPLRMVASYVDLLESEYGDELDEEAAEYMEFAVDGARRMQDMIDALLQYARVQTRAGAFEQTDPNAVVDQTREALQLRIEETDATVTVEQLPRVEADPDQLGQVFQNLMKNAITYADEDGVEPTVEITATSEDGMVAFEVADNGPGVEAGSHDDIFEIFKRNGSHEAEGTGIGLAVCRRIVRRHGGEIAVSSEEGDGATFTFTVPAAGEEVSADD